MLDIVVVNWNAGAQIRTCIDSIAKYGSGLVNKTIVVDNGSVDGSDESVEGLPNVTLIRTGTNLGFGKACNLGAQQAKSEFILFLNPDAALYVDTLVKVLAYMQDAANSKVGICGVQLLDEAGHVSRSCSRFPSVFGFSVHAAGLVHFAPFLGHSMAEWDHAETRQVNQVIGAFFMVRRDLFLLLNGFDERFFVYYEEVDFSYRAHQAGWLSLFIADVQAFHAGGGTSNQVKARRLFYSLRSRVLYAFKHFCLPGALLVLFVTFLMEPMTRMAYALLRRSWSTVTETWAGYAMLWRWLPQWILKGVTR